TGKKIPKDQNYDIWQELGKPCLLTVVHNTKGYPKVSSVAAVPKTMTVPPAQHEPVFWTIGEYRHEGEGKLPEWADCHVRHGGPIAKHTNRSREITGVVEFGNSPTASGGKAAY